VRPMPPLARRTVLLALAWIAAGIHAGCGGARAQPRPPAQSPLLGKPIKHFKRRALDGRMLDTASLAGSVIVIEFFAKYCEPCARTLPEAQALSRELDEVRFIGISEDESWSQAELVAKEHGLTFPIVHDGGNVLAGRFRVSELPVTFVVDRQGIVSWVGSAEHTELDLRAAIRAAGR
jgi:cytochrome c biogenesis protein CcmG, thiol:disulfide interchange protein DsbE